jgi:hypothetical protein
MGLHSGEPARHEDGYIGLDVHRAARIAAAAHGGQVVLSEATRLVVEPQLPAGVSVRDLGFHRLKDIEAPERIYQLVAVGLQEQFPPLKSLGAPVATVGATAGVHGFLLPAADDVRILATSREPAGVAGEARYRLPPLGLPEPGQMGKPTGRRRWRCSLTGPARRTWISP